MQTVAVYDTRPHDREHLLRAAEGEGVAIDWRFLEFRLTPDTAVAATGAEAICVFVNDQVDRPGLERLRDAGVKTVSLRCTGFNNVDCAAARDLGFRVTRVSIYSPYAVAEHALALLLTLNRKIHRAYNRVRELNFSVNGLVGFDLQGKTAGIVGTGKIGKVIARIFKGFGMRVVAFDPFPDREWAAAAEVTYLDWPALARSSDVISLHAPLTPETHHIVRAETLEQMKPGVVLINVSRGGLIATADLIQALKRGHVGGVALDVYEEEEGVFFEDLSGQVLQDDDLARLLTFPNVLITSHQAFLTREALHEIARVTVTNLQALATGAPCIEGTVLV